MVRSLLMRLCHCQAVSYVFHPFDMKIKKKINKIHNLKIDVMDKTF